MGTEIKRGRTVSVVLNPRNQNIDGLQKLVAQISGRVGCDGCGRIARMHFEFLGDPPPEVANPGVISYLEDVAAR